MKKLILASGSPRRKEILEQVGLTFLVCPSEVEEVITKEKPSEIVMELSKQKAEDVYKKMADRDAIVIGADTVVALDGKILGKPKDREEAEAMLFMLSGKKHCVYTGVTLIAEEKTITFYEETEVEFYPLTKAEVDAYLASEESYDKAGAYGIQGKAAAFIKGICGDYYNVVGLPIAKLMRNLQKM